MGGAIGAGGSSGSGGGGGGIRSGGGGSNGGGCRMISGVAVAVGVGVGVTVGGGAGIRTFPPSCGKRPGSGTTPVQEVTPVASTGEQGWLRVPAGWFCALATSMTRIGLNPTGGPVSAPTKVKLPVMVNSTQLLSGRGQDPCSIGPTAKKPVEGLVGCGKARSVTGVAVAVAVT